MKGLSKRDEELIRDVVSRLQTLDEQRLMSYWISSEIDEAETYNRLANLAEEYSWDERISLLFRQLARESLEHAEILMKEYQRRYPGEGLLEVDIPRIEMELRLDELERILRQGNLEDIIERLMDSERIARDIYAYLANHSQEETAELFKNLSKIEHGHYKKLVELKKALRG